MERRSDFVSNANSIQGGQSTFFAVLVAEGEESGRKLITFQCGETIKKKKKIKKRISVSERVAYTTKYNVYVRIQCSTVGTAVRKLVGDPETPLPRRRADAQKRVKTVRMFAQKPRRDAAAAACTSIDIRWCG